MIFLGGFFVWAFWGTRVEKGLLAFCVIFFFFSKILFCSLNLIKSLFFIPKF